jgi:adenylate kinase family enzyme
MDPLLPNKNSCKEKELCDVTKFEIRSDDKKEVIASRMKEYAEKTEPLIKEFEKKNVLMNFEVKQGVKDYPELKKQVLEKLSKVK